MFFPEGRIRVRLYGRPCDRRQSFDGLQALRRHEFGCGPLDGSLHVDVNRRGTQIKCLYFDRSGFCVWAKRLEAGRFIADGRRVRTCELDWTQLKLLLEGIEVRRVRKRYALPAVSVQSLYITALQRIRRATLRLVHNALPTTATSPEAMTLSTSELVAMVRSHAR